MPEKPEKCEDHVGEEARDQKTADTPVMSDEVIRVMTGHFSANLIIDPLDGRILAANPPARELLSLEAEDLPTVADLSEKGFPPWTGSPDSGISSPRYSVLSFTEHPARSGNSDSAGGV
jgi:hypothetical protein